MERLRGWSAARVTHLPHVQLVLGCAPALLAPRKIYGGEHEHRILSSIHFGLPPLLSNLHYPAHDDIAHLAVVARAKRSYRHQLVYAFHHAGNRCN